MSTPKQAAAGRANSVNSTSPSSEGQAASRYNPLKHGINAQQQIMFDESAEDLAELAAEYHEHHIPADSGQRLLVDTLIHNEWRLRRTRRVEAVLWEHAADTYLTQHPEAEACNSAHAFTTNAGYFERLQRIVNGCERNYHRALKELQSLKVKVGQALPPANVPANPDAPPQKAAASPEAPPQAPQPQQSKTTSTKLGSVRQNPKTPPPAPPQPPVADPPAPSFASPLAGQHVPASPAETQPSPSHRFPTPQEAMDAALLAILKESSTDL
jgi:hypothetical protein